MRRAAVLLLLAATALAAGAATAEAHGGLTQADPVPGARLGAGPEVVRLTFSERPAASLSTITVIDAGGGSVTSARTRVAPGDSETLQVPLRQLRRGVYTVKFKIVSDVDGHATTGEYAFGVQASPGEAGVTAETTKPSTSKLEVVARWALLVGLVLLLGAAVAGAARYGGDTGSDARLAAAGWLVAALGVALLVIAQRRTADTSLSDLADTKVGHALIWRAVAVNAAGVALVVGAFRPALRRPALAAAALFALAAITIHVAHGHAAAGPWPASLTVTTQVAHFAAAGIWIGGLAALLLGTRGTPDDAKAAAVRRFATAAAIALIIVLVTGTIRAIDELSSLDDLLDTGYGRAILAKILLIGLLAGLGWRQRTRNVPNAGTDLAPLRRTGRLELIAAGAALAVAALLGTLAPPVTGRPAGAPTELTASASDRAHTLRVKLTTASVEPGPNRFVAHVEEYDSHDAVKGARVRLRFTPLDDPDVTPTNLALRPSAKGDYAGSGPNLAFDGRWRATALIRRNRQTTEVPLGLDVPGPDQSVSILRAPTQPHAYTLQLANNLGYIQISPRPDRAGPSRVFVVFFDIFENKVPVARATVTAQAKDGPVRRVSVRRITPRRYEADVALKSGKFHIAVTARLLSHDRVRGVFDLDVPDS